jgi:hypothetical protein
MNGQIPQDADVMLEQAEVHANRVVVVELTELLFFHKLADLPNRAHIYERMTDHQQSLAALRFFQQAFALL